jgi:hypothetical protein
MKILNTLLITMLFVGCTSNEENEITGKWLMYKVIQDGQNVTSEHDPYDERFLILKSDSSFESGGRPFGKNTGRYVFSSVDHTLFLDSDIGPEDDSQWKVTIQGDTMQWRGYGSEWAKGFELFHIKAK